MFGYSSKPPTARRNIKGQGISFNALPPHFYHRATFAIIHIDSSCTTPSNSPFAQWIFPSFLHPSQPPVSSNDVIFSSSDGGTHKATTTSSYLTHASLLPLIQAPSSLQKKCPYNNIYARPL
ncbi:hypothetical protein BDP27DRAFT_436616 [Rhodocollybia butyracea]|nr:hypothetical protein BDP27DRAFT_436616 [Rhodocollybia butyracea]